MGKGGSRTFRGGALALLALLLLALAGCGGGGSDGGDTGTAQRGGTLKLDFGEEPTGLDPLSNYTYPEINIISQINETLFKTNADGKVEPFLVKSYEKTPDQKTWTLQLQEGVTFSDGKPMTSADVVFSLESVRKSPLWETIFGTVQSVRAPSPSTVVINGSKPMPALPASLTLFAAAVVPKNYGGVAQKEFAQNPIGTGPFEIGTWKRGQSLTLVRNPSYWGPDKALLDEVVITASPSPESRMTQLRAGQIDVNFDPPWSQVESIESTPGLEVGKYALGLTDYLIVNSQKPLFKDPRAREAISLALNREDIVKAALNDYGPPAGSWFPLSLPYADSSIEPPQQDIAKASKLLDEAVKATGEKPSFELLFSGQGSYAAIAQVAQQNLEEAGFEVKLKTLDQAVTLELLDKGEFDVDILSIYSTIPDPTELVTFYVGTEALWSRADTTEVSKLGEEAASEADSEKRRDLYYRIQEILDEEHFIITTNDRPWLYALRDNVSGFSVGPTGTPWLNEVGFSE